MGYIVLSKQQVEGGLNVKLCKDKASADSYRKQLIKQYYDVVILDKSDYDVISTNFFKNWVYELDGHRGDDINSDKHNGYSGDEEAHKAWDKEGEGKVLENTFINAFGDDENDDLAPQCFHVDEDGDEYYLSSNGKRYYLFKKVVTLKGDREQTIYTFGKKTWLEGIDGVRDDLTLLRSCGIPNDKVVVESKNGYPFLKTDSPYTKEIIKKYNKINNSTPKWDL